ncbi:TIR domain-containing protein [Clostridium botulinum]|uniref:TIR domain-containing protein n=1 Tax=Clostridium botulinum TaxID=1491 RepID=A0A6M0SS65_CLOBO|nr:TIR domain-containing protein [Clostridium botulinum]
MNKINNHKVELFISYEHNDEKLRSELEKHLKSLEKNSIISIWHDRKIVAGSERQNEIDEHLRSSQIILLLISSDFITSDYCYGQEMNIAIERHYNNEAIVIPIILRAVDGWKLTPFGKLEVLPKNTVPITSWNNLDEAFSNVVKEIRERIQIFVNKNNNVYEEEIDNNFSEKYVRNINKGIEKSHLLKKDNMSGRVIHNRLKESAPYTYRNDFILKILKQLKENKVVVITGLGGIGKTQLAANYITNYINEYKLIGWINASDAVSIQNSYIELVEKLDSEFLDANINQNTILRYVKNWLENNDKWLIIYDNVKNPKELNELLPNPINGHVIITSQNAKWSKFNPTIEVTQLTNRESINFLMKRAEKDYETSMEELVSLLDNFPLSLEHAASYVHKTSRSFSYYLNKFKSRKGEMLSKAKRPEDYNHTIATTWEIAFDEIKENCQDAIEFLYFISFLAPDDIPLEMLKLEEESDINIIEILRDDFRIDDVIENLLNYSLINCNNNCTNMINIHRLVQIVVRYKLSQDIEEEWCKNIINIFNQIFRDDRNNLSSQLHFKELLPHAIQVIENAINIGIKSKELSFLCENVGLLLNEIADYSKAIKILKYGLNIGKKIFDYNCEDIAKYIINLGLVEKLSGNISEGIRYYNKAVNIYEKLNLTCSVEYAKLINNIGRVKMDQGKYDESYGLILKSFNILENLNVEYNIENILILSNLALSLEHIGNIDDSIRYNRKVLGILKKNNINESQAMATCLNNLSTCLWKKGKLCSAFILSSRVVKIEESIFGDRHPTVALYYSNLANLLICRGDLLQARNYIVKAFKINRYIYGMDHYSIGKELFNCFCLLSEQKKYKPAKICLEKSINIYKKFYGKTYSELSEDYFRLAEVIMKIIDNSFLEVNLKLRYAEEAKLNLYQSLSIKYSEKSRAMLNFVEFIINKLSNRISSGIENKEKDKNLINIFFFMERNIHIYLIMIIFRICI